VGVETVAAIAGAVSAAAGTASAIAAWRAAKASWRTSRDASEALALAVRPRLSFRPIVMTDPRGTRRVLVIKNITEHDAVEVDVEVRGRDGNVTRDSIRRLRPTVHRTWKQIDRQNDAHIDLDTAPSAELDRSVVRYSDARGLARYEREERYIVERHGPDERGITGHAEWTEAREERISGP
jgi:hypothetical protein